MTTFTEDEREELEERSAIMEHHGGMTKPEAERAALRRILEKRERGDGQDT
jgi:hypothetical protein